MRDDELTARYPRVYHLAYGPEVWPSLQRHGLLSVAALLERWELTTTDRAEILRRHRPGTIQLDHPVHGTAYLRDQHPLNVSMLERALTDMTVADWLEQLNQYVYFAPTRKRLQALYDAYADLPRLVLTLNTESLLAEHHHRIRLSPINTGAVRHVNHTRGSDTLRRIGPWEPRREVAELAVAGSVPDVTAHVTRVETWHPDGARARLV